MKNVCHTLALLGTEHLPHDTRYTFATLMHNAKADDITPKKIMRHKIDDITKGVYTQIALKNTTRNI
mgnify:FL=1